VTSLNTYLTVGGQNGNFARDFIALHKGNAVKAERCWDRQVNEPLNDHEEASVIPYGARAAWAEEKAKWKLWFWAVMSDKCAAPA
jgi:hypothetical protein